MLKQSGQVVWQHKFLWVLGFFAGLNGLLFDLLRLFWGAQFTAQLRALWAWAQQPQPTVATLPFDLNVTEADLAQFSLGFGGMLFVVFIGFWLVATIAEAGIIQAVIDLEREQSVGLGAAVKAGLRWLGRFVAIDAAVFLPWFLLALTIFLIMIVLILAMGYLGFNGADLSAVFLLLGVGSLCLIPLILLLLPVAWLSFIYRILAFRDAAWGDHGARRAVKQPWRVVKRHWGTAVLMTLLMVAVQSMGNWIVGLISLPIYGALAYLGAESSVAMLGGVGLVLSRAMFAGIIYAYIAVAWTIAYKYWLTHENENGINI